MKETADRAPRVHRHGDATLAYRLRGEGPPVILVQGVGLHGDGWLPQVRTLAGRYTCVTFDNRGMGASLPVDPRLEVATMAGDLLALMDAVAWPSAHLVGHSLGGLVALQVAAVARRRVRSLSLLCTVARGRDATRVTGRIARLGLASLVGTRRSRRSAFLDVVMSRYGLVGADRESLAAAMAPYFGHDLAEQPAGTGPQLRALRAYDARPHLPALAGLPTLVVSAEEDPIAPPRFGRALADAIAGARFVSIADAAHGVTIERADEVNRLLIEHLDAVEGRRSGPVS